ncbi:unnamed protein product, partial [Bubo scandiacus]
AFPQGFSRLPSTVTGLFNMAWEGGEWLENRAGNWSQAVISFHMSSVTFSAKLHLFAFSTSKWA